MKNVTRFGLDSAPLIYFIEQHPDFYKSVLPVFQRLASRRIMAFTASLTITEVLTHPYKLGKSDLIAAYWDILLHNPSVEVVSLTPVIARRAAELRAKYHLRTPDAIQIATALQRGCTAFLTNDLKLRAVTELDVVTITDLSDA